MNPASQGAKGRGPALGHFAAAAWVLFSAWCSLTGWALSALGCLHARGYAVSFLLGGFIFFLWIRYAGFPRLAGIRRKPLIRRFARPLPFIFLLAAVCTLVGGALYAPVNYDAITYRLPRIFEWLAEGRWYWIDTLNHRMNYSGTGFEWLMIPVFLAGHGDRFLFLLNFLPWLLIPGATFACLRGMGVRPRVAWWWMWLLPLGHCFVLQAGGIGNDSYAVLYLLLSVSLALRARHTGRIADLWIAAIAAALLTGSKASSLPLFLPFVMAAWPAIPLLRKKIIASSGVVVLCVVVSFLPLAVMNHLNTGSWTGDPLNKTKMSLRNPVAAFEGNAMQIFIHNIEPPVLASGWNGAARRFTHTHFVEKLMKDYPRFSLESAELASEEGSGAGMGLTSLFLIALAARWWKPAAAHPKKYAPGAAHGRWIALGGWIALAVYMAKIGSESAPRLIAPYYPVCFAIALFHPVNSVLVRCRWWRVAAVVLSLSVFPSMILSPSRPLWPAKTVTSGLAASHPGNGMIERMNTVYDVYSHRSDLFAPISRYIPESEHTLFLLSNGDDPSTSLWRPFDGRRVVDFFPGNESKVLGQYHKIIMVASRDGIMQRYGKTAEAWISEKGARIIAKEAINVKIHRGPPEDWFVLELQEKPGK